MSDRRIAGAGERLADLVAERLAVCWVRASALVHQTHGSDPLSSDCMSRKQEQEMETKRQRESRGRGIREAVENRLLPFKTTPFVSLPEVLACEDELLSSCAERL